MLPLSDEASRRTFPFVTVAIILLNVLVFIYELSLGDGVQQLVESAGVVPAEYACRCDIPPVDVGPFWVTLFTSMWLHGGWLHLIGNMVYLWIFGDNVEDALGHLGYLAFYLGGGIVAGGTQILAGPDSRCRGSEPVARSPLSWRRTSATCPIRARSLTRLRRRCRSAGCRWTSGP